MSDALATVAGVDAEQRFAAVADEFAGLDGITAPGNGRGFGRLTLRVDGRIFAMLVRGALAVKLPKERVDELVASGAGTRLDTGKRTPMKEWFCAGPAAPLDWSALAREALEFVR